MHVDKGEREPSPLLVSWYPRHSPPSLTSYVYFPINVDYSRTLAPCLPLEGGSSGLRHYRSFFPSHPAQVPCSFPSFCGGRYRALTFHDHHPTSFELLSTNPTVVFSKAISTQVPQATPTSNCWRGADVYLRNTVSRVPPYSQVTLLHLSSASEAVLYLTVVTVCLIREAGYPPLDKTPTTDSQEAQQWNWKSKTRGLRLGVSHK